MGDIYALIPEQYGTATVPAYSSIVTLLDDNTDMVGFVGSVKWEDGGTHNIASAYLKWGTCTAGTGSTLEVSLQDVASTGFPDGTVDQSVTTTIMPASNAFSQYTFTGVRSSVATGTLLSIVARLTVFGSSTVLRLNGIGDLKQTADLPAYGVRYTGGAWSKVGALTPVIVFVSDDASPKYGTFVGACPFSAIGSINFHAGSATDEYGLEFTAIDGMTAMGGNAYIAVLNVAVNHSLKLYNSGGTVIGSQSYDGDQIGVTGSARFCNAAFAPVALTSGQTYRWAVSRDDAATNNLTIYYADVADAAHWAVADDRNLVPMSAVSRVDGGSWSAATTTRRYWMCVDFKIATSGGTTSGIIEHGKLGGGF